MRLSSEATAAEGSLTPGQQAAGARGGGLIIDSLRKRIAHSPGLAVRAQRMLDSRDPAAARQHRLEAFGVDRDVVDFGGGGLPWGSDHTTVHEHLKQVDTRVRALAERVAELGPNAGVMRLAHLSEQGFQVARVWRIGPEWRVGAPDPFAHCRPS